MYLRCRKYVPDYANNEDGSMQFGIRKNNLFSINGVNVNAEQVCEIVEEVGYWRKANQIHNWFVENVQNGNDDCRDYYVDPEDLQKLLDTVNEVLNSIELIDGEVINGYTIKDGKSIPIKEPGKIIKDPTIADKLLPTSEGFFFGSTEYNEYYYEDLVHTKNILEKALAQNDLFSDYYYHSSW